jgi:hypothetical protein
LKDLADQDFQILPHLQGSLEGCHSAFRPPRGRTEAGSLLDTSPPGAPNYTPRRQIFHCAAPSKPSLPLLSRSADQTAQPMLLVAGLYAGGRRRPDRAVSQQCPRSRLYDDRCSCEHDGNQRAIWTKYPGTMTATCFFCMDAKNTKNATMHDTWPCMARRMHTQPIPEAAVGDAAEPAPRRATTTVLLYQPRLRFSFNIAWPSAPVRGAAQHPA